MENDEGQDIYLKQFIQRQENLLLDFLRKNIDLEIRVSALNASNKDLLKKYEESQKQVEFQNELMQQAAKGVESLTVDKKVFQEKETEYQRNIENLNKTIEDLKRSLHDCKTEREEITRKHNEISLNISGSDKRYNDLMEEYRRQTEELNELFKKNEELKNQPINKKKTKSQAILPSDEF